MKDQKRSHVLNSRTVGLAIAETRKQAGLTQEDLGDRIGMQRSELSAIERGDRMPTLDTFFRISCGLAVPASEIMRKIEEMTA